MKRITNPTSLKEYLSPQRKTSALFILSTCPFCRAFRPEFEKFEELKSAECDFIEVTLDDFENPLWEKYRIDVVPTVIVFDGGEIAARADGRGGEGLTGEDLKRVLL